MATTKTQRAKKVTLLIHDGQSEPRQGEPWLIVQLTKRGSAWDISGRVRCDLTVQRIKPDVITHPGCVKGNMKLRLKGKWSDEEIDSAVEKVSYIQSVLLLSTARKAKKAGVEKVLR